MAEAPTLRYGNKGQLLCTGKRRNGSQCSGTAVKPTTKCRMHGGKSLRATASPLFRNGRYSKDLSLSLGEKYQTARDDPNLHSLIDEIALTQARLQDLLERTATSDLGHAWLDLRNAWNAFADARDAGNMKAMAEALGAIETITRRGQQDYLLWQEISDKIRLLADLRVKEHKRLLDLESVIPAERATILFGLLQRAVHTAVTTHASPDIARAILRAIQDGIRGFAPGVVAPARLRGGDEPDDVIAGAAYTDLSRPPA